MTRSKPRPSRQPKTPPAQRAQTVFRDFVRALEKLDAGTPKKDGGR